MKNRSVTWALALLLASVSWGAQASTTPNCGDLETQRAMNQCYAEHYAREDARLNRIYRELVAATDNARRANLKAVQKAWLSYRTLHCRYLAAPYEGGSIQPAIVNDCLLGLTRSRNAELEALLQEARL